MAALLTRGHLEGTHYGTPKSVIVVATEDSWGHTIVPRLVAAGADLDRVYRVDVVTSVGADATLTLPKDIDGLEQAAHDVDAAMVLLDPLLSRLDSALDTHKDAEVRRAMEPLIASAERTGMAYVALIHLNKSAAADVLSTLMASRAFAAVARAVLYVMADPDDEGVRLLGLAKNNLGRLDLPTLTFKIVGVCVADTPEGPVWTGKLEWLGESERSIRDAVEAAADRGHHDISAVSEATDWLMDYLAQQGGSCASAEVKRAGVKVGHSPDALKRARKTARILADGRGFPRQTYWSLPLASQSEQPQSEQVSGETAPTTPTAPTEESQGKRPTQLEQA